MRGAPQVGFSATMRKISSRNSRLTHFLPARLRCRESHVQYNLNPARCSEQRSLAGQESTLVSIPARGAAISPKTICSVRQIAGEDASVSRRRAAAGEPSFPTIDRGESNRIEVPERTVASANGACAICSRIDARSAAEFPLVSCKLNSGGVGRNDSGRTGSIAARDHLVCHARRNSARRSGL